MSGTYQGHFRKDGIGNQDVQSPRITKKRWRR